MLFEAVTSQRPLDRYKVLESKLAAMDRDLTEYRGKSVSSLREAIRELDKRLTETRLSSGFMDFVKDDNYVADVYTKSALECLSEFKIQRDKSTVLVPGMTYYSASVSNGRVTGNRCHFLSEDRAFWSPVNEDARVLKALEVSQWGSAEDFRKIYFEMADGRDFECFENVTLDHIKESSDEALNRIEAYCDRLWEGKWPWEVKAPSKLKTIVKENTDMTRRSVREYHEEFNGLLDTLSEGEIEKSEIITRMQGYVQDIDSMLEKLARVSGNLMTDTRESVRSEFGDEAAQRISDEVGQHISSAAEGLGQLKSSWTQQLESLANGGVEERPEFDDPLDPEADAMAGAGIDGEEPEAELPDEEGLEGDADFDDEMEDGDDDLEAERDMK
jgi:hypothetical protein